MSKKAFENYNHLEQMEGYRTQGYTVSGTDSSGITIGFGVDLSQPPYNTPEGLLSAGFDQSFVDNVVGLDILGKDVGTLKSEGKDPNQLASQVTLPDDEDTKINQFNIVKNSILERIEPYRETMDPIAQESFATLTHWGGSAMSNENRSAIEDPNKLGPYQRKAYVFGVIQDGIDNIISDKGYITNDEYQAVILKGQNSISNFKDLSPLNTQTLNREMSFVSDSTGFAVNQNNYLQILEPKQKETVEGISADEPTMEEQAAEIERKKQREFQPETVDTIPVKPLPEAQDPEIKKATEPEIDEETQENITRGSEETEEEKIEIFTPSQPIIDPVTGEIIEQAGKGPTKQDVEKKPKEETVEITIGGKKYKVPKSEATPVDTDQVNEDLAKSMASKINVASVEEEEIKVEQGQEQVGPTVKNLEKKEAIEENKKYSPRANTYKEDRDFINNNESDSEDDQLYNFKKERYEQALRVADRIMGDDHDFGEDAEAMREAILAVINQDEFNQVQEEYARGFPGLFGFEGDILDNQVRAAIIFRAQNLLLEQRSEELNNQNDFLELDEKILSNNKTNIEERINDNNSAVEDLQQEWKQIKQNGYYVYSGYKQTWVPNFKNKEQEEQYNAWVTRTEAVNEDRLAINEDIKKFDNKASKFKEERDKFVTNTNNFFENIAFNHVEGVFNSVHDGIQITYDDEGRATISSKFNEAIRNKFDNTIVYGGPTGLIDLGKAFDIVSTTINSYAKYRVLERALRNRVVVGLGIGTAAGAYITDALNINPNRGKDLFTGETYSALDFVTDKYTQLANKNILPVSENVPNPVFSPDGFLKFNNDADLYGVGKFLGNSLTYMYALSSISKNMLTKRNALIKSGKLKQVTAKQIKYWNRKGALGYKSSLFGIYDTGSKVAFNRNFFNSLHKKYRFTQKAAVNFNQIGATARMTYLSNVGELKAQGVSSEMALMGASFMSLATGISQSIMPDYLWFTTQAGRTAVKTYASSLNSLGVKSLSSQARIAGAKVAGQTFLKNTFKELGEEILDFAVNDIIQQSFVTGRSSELLEMQKINEVVMGTLMMVSIPGAARGRKNYQAIRDYVVQETYYDGAKLYKSLAERIQPVDTEIKRLEKITTRSKEENEYLKVLKKEKNADLKALNEIGNILDVIKVAPKFVTTETVDLMIKKNDLIKKKKEITDKKDITLHSREIQELNSQIEQLNTEIQQTDYFAKKEQIGKKLLADGFALAQKEGVRTIDIAKVQNEQEFRDFRNVENAYRRQVNKTIAEEQNKIKADESNYDKNGNLKKSAEKKLQQLEGKKLTTIPTYGDSKKESEGIIYYDDVSGDHVIVINSDKAIESGNFAVVHHELFHGMLRKSMINNPEMMTRLAYVLRQELKNNPGLSRYIISKFGSYANGNITAKNADELMVIMSEALLLRRTAVSKNFLNRFADVIRRVGREFGVTVKIKDVRDLIAFIEDYSREAKRGRFSKALKKVKEQGLQSTVKLKAKQRKSLQKETRIGALIERVTGAVKGMSQSVYTNEKLIVDLDLSDNTQKIVAKNAEIRQRILDEGITKNGKIVASPALQDELVANNLPLAVNLAKFAANNPNIAQLEEGKRVSFDQFLSGYYENLVDLARTYDASVNEFGQYLNTLLPLRYGQILRGETAGQVEGTVSIDAKEARQVADTEQGMTERYSDSETIMPDVNVANRLGGTELQDQIEDHFNKGVSMIINGPAKGQTQKQWLKELTDLGFADLDGTLPDLSNIDFSQVQPYAFPIIADYYGVDRDKLDWRLNKKNKDKGLIPKGKKASFMANLRIDSKKGTNELQTIQRRIRSNPELHIVASLPKAFVGTKEKPIKSNKVRPLLLKSFYNKGEKINNVNLFFRFPVVDTNAYLEKVGIVDKKADRSDRNTSAFANAVVFEVARKVSAQGIKQALAKNGDLHDKVRVGLDDGINKFSESLAFKEASLGDQKIILAGVKQMEERLLALIIDLPGDENNKELRKEVKKLFKQTFEDKINKSLQIKLADSLLGKTGIVTKYGTMINNYAVNRGFLPELRQFVKEELHSYNETKDVYELLGLYGEGETDLTRPDAFTKLDVERGRANLLRIAQDLIAQVESGKLEKRKAIAYMLMLKGIYGKASRIADKGLVGDGLVRVKVNNSELGGFRASVISSIGDFTKLINSVDNGFFELNLSETKLKEKYNLTITSDQSSEVIENYLQNNEITQELNEQAELARDLTKYLFIWNWNKYGSKENKKDKMMFAQFLFNLGSNMNSPSRKAAKIFGIATNVISENNKILIPANQINRLTTYEHAKPHHVLLSQITDVLQNNAKKDWDNLIDKVFDDYVVNIIKGKTKDNVDFDDLLSRSGLSSKVQRSYDTEADINNVNEVLQTSIGRLYNDITHGDSRTSAIKVVNKDFTLHNKIIGKEFEANGKPKVSQSLSYQEAAKTARSISYNEELKGISILDFDDTLATTNSKVKYTSPDGTQGTLNAEEYAKNYVNLLNRGYTFDFSEFNEVVEGKVGPLFDKALKLAEKYGTEDMFILTARPPEAQRAIYDFLNSVGLHIPYDNITGLANSTAEAKALWITKKVEEGYNDIYFADDALQNVKEVENVLNQLDVKSKVQQAKVSRSEKYDEQFNDILEEQSGVSSEKRFSETKARRRGADKGKYRFFIPPSAEDFLGLIYNFLPKGAKGERALKFFKEALLDPFANAITAVNNARQVMMSEYNELVKSTPGIRKRLNEKVLDGDFTVEDAVRVYLWDKAGFKIPGLSETDKKALLKIVNQDEQLTSFAMSVSKISRQKEGYLEPDVEWEVDNIKYDLFQKSNRIKRADFLTEFKKNRETIFGKWDGRKLVGANMNKIEAIYGKPFRQALEDILWRMENGTNRGFGDNKMVNDFMNWLNGSVAATMFVNMRSALLQQLSFVNFINWEDNNIFAASKAFANQTQFWTDFTFLFNSNFLKERRSGLRSDLNASELVNHLSKSRNKTKAALRYLLQKGFLPTQIADSFAIAIGGASFYRNRRNKYIAEGMTEKEAEKKAFKDFQETAERTQQSARADMISQEQASVLGRLILAFQNTPMQYARLTKRAAQDLINGRGSMKANLSKIIYYGFVQNLIFYTLQSAMFALMFEDDDDEEYINQKGQRVLNGMLDSFLRGTGVAGGVVSTLKNMALRAMRESDKGSRGDYAYVLIEALNLSPPVGIKARKIYAATQSYKFNRREIENMGYLDIDNPTYEVATSTIEGLFNLPVARAYNKIRNIRAALDKDNAIWQRIALVLGWNTWDLGIERARLTRGVKYRSTISKQRNKKRKGLYKSNLQ
tara:strand:+ start:128 stop:10039 length:9912 start_codon:yes stop_codon:yes gene_type:complete